MAEAGACEIVVHARTKLDGYRPPAYWELIPHIREAVAVPVIANGEIWSVADALRCRAQSGCEDLMLGRGSVAYPGLALAIRAAVAGGVSIKNGAAVEGGEQPAEQPLKQSVVTWQALLPQIARFWQMVCEDLEPGQRAGRLKQWFNLLRRHYPEAEIAFQELRVQTDQRAITQWVAGLRERGDSWSGVEPRL
jgi:tRNA-dihydrouridine synthase C